MNGNDAVFGCSIAFPNPLDWNLFVLDFSVETLLAHLTRVSALLLTLGGDDQSLLFETHWSAIAALRHTTHVGVDVFTSLLRICSHVRSKSLFSTQLSCDGLQN
jgi:hypothetical protein